MSRLADFEIRGLCENSVSPLIDPFVPHQVRVETSGRNVVSYGLSSYGYDIRIGEHFLVFSNLKGGVVDPKKTNSDMLFEVNTKAPVVIPPNSFVLGTSVEYIRMSRGLIAICLGKSTYARVGISINVTPLEPDWIGNITIEIANNTTLPAKVYPNEGIGQLVFLGGATTCEVSYADRAGKYQDQRGVTPAKV